MFDVFCDICLKNIFLVSLNCFWYVVIKYFLSLDFYIFKWLVLVLEGEAGYSSEGVGTGVDNGVRYGVGKGVISGF